MEKRNEFNVTIWTHDRISQSERNSLVELIRTAVAFELGIAEFDFWKVDCHDITEA